MLIVYNAPIMVKSTDHQASASHLSENQIKTNKLQKGVKIVEEQTINVLFKKIPTTVQKIIYDFTGLKSAILGTTDKKMLIVYYVIEKIRGNYVSCVLSYWNNDYLNPSGLPQLLEDLMTIQK